MTETDGDGLPFGRRIATTLPCPPWCRHHDDGHPFVAVDPFANPLRVLVHGGTKAPWERLYRVHEARFGERATHITVETWERTTDPTTAAASDLGTQPEATLVRVNLDPNGSGYLSPAGARRLAELLHQAADLADAQRKRDAQ